MIQALQKYDLNDGLIVPMICLPLAVILNSIYFSSLYFSSAGFFLISTFISFTELALNFFCCALVAYMLLQRFPKPEEVFKKLAFMITTFLLISVFLKFLLFKAYSVMPLFKTELNESRLAWVCLSISVACIFFAFLIEGIDRYEAWQSNWRQSQLLQVSLRQSQLNALKSHISPHFLFNNLNTLSSLIEEDEATSEQFLNEMTRVYRYMLKNEGNQWVPLREELQFLHSYLYLLQERHGEALLVEENITGAEHFFIVPMLLQVIIENALEQNVISKQKPMRISIVHKEGWLLVKHPLQRKTFGKGGAAAGVVNMIKKYRLMGKSLILQETASGAKYQIELYDENQ